MKVVIGIVLMVLVSAATGFAVSVSESTTLAILVMGIGMAINMCVGAWTGVQIVKLWEKRCT